MPAERIAPARHDRPARAPRRRRRRGSRASRDREAGGPGATEALVDSLGRLAAADRRLAPARRAASLPSPPLEHALLQTALDHQVADPHRDREKRRQLRIESRHLYEVLASAVCPQTSRPTLRVGVSLEIGVATAPIGHVRVELGRGEIGVPEHLLDAAQVGASLEEMSGERVAQQMRVHPFRLEARLAGELAQDQERARARERATLGVEEELGAVSAVEMWAAVRQITTQCLRGLPADRDDALLAALADRADEAVVQVDAAALETDRLADPEAGAVQELDQSVVAEGPRRRSPRRLDEPFGFPRRQCAREAARPPREVEVCGGVVGPSAQERLVAEERADRGGAPRDRGR